MLSATSERTPPVRLAPGTGPQRRGAAPRSRRHRRAALATVCLAVAIAAAYLLWFRGSSLVRIDQVSISGLTTRQAPEIHADLSAVARSMTTLDLDVGRLEHAVASYPSVAGIEARPDFPNGLAIEVIERKPVAIVPADDGGATPVAADGTLLPDAELNGPLATLPAAGSIAGARLRDSGALAALEVVAAAPPALVGRIAEVGPGVDGGLEARLREGLTIVLGDGSRLEAKWLAAAAAIAEGGAADAAYLDVSVPERPAAGGQQP